MRVVFSVRFEADLEDIAVYIAQDNVPRALSFTDELEAKALSLANAPFKGVERNRLRPGIRLLPYGNYNIYYRIESDVIQVLRIFHSARDIGPDDFA